jgi:hypothetical protein
VLVQHPPVHWVTVTIHKIVLRHAGQDGHRRTDVYQAGVGRGIPLSANARPGEDQRRPGLDDVEGAVLPDVPALVGEVVARGVDDGEVR